MLCHNCNTRCKKFGKHRKGLQRFRCRQCAKTFTEDHATKWENLKAAIALHFAWYNFCHIHRTLRSTPAMEAGIPDHIWTIPELLGAAI